MTRKSIVILPLMLVLASLLTACDADDSPVAPTPTPDIGGKQTEAARPTVTPIPSSPCAVEVAACELAAAVSRDLGAGDFQAILDRAVPVERACPDVSPVKEVCTQLGTATVSGFTRVAAGKAFEFVPEQPFIEVTLADLGNLRGSKGVISVGCSGSIPGEPGSCEKFTTLALGDQSDTANSPVVLLFFERSSSGDKWNLVGSGRWYSDGPPVNGGPLGIWVAGRDANLHIWFSPLL